MRRIYYFLFSLTIVLLSSVQTALAQNVIGGIVSVDKLVHDYGNVLESDKNLECTFTFTNVSDKPIVIHSVVTSCGCADPSWTKSPIKPNESGFVKIRYTNNQGPYPFSKNITVYISGLQKPVILKIKGVAYKKPKTLDELYPQRLGPLGFKSYFFSTDNIPQGASASLEIEVTNLTTHDTEIDFADLDPGLSIKMPDKKIPAGMVRTFTCTINTLETKETLWGHNNFTFTVLNNGKSYKNALSIITSIYDNFSSMTSQERHDAPLPKFELSSKDFGKVKDGDILEFDFAFKNMGKSPFLIHRAEPYLNGVLVDFITIDLSGSVEGGAKGNVHIKVDTSGQPEGTNMAIVNMITNSPSRPLVNLFLVYDIE